MTKRDPMLAQMLERVLACLNCGAPVTPPSKWAHSAICAHCKATVMVDPSSVAVAPYRKAKQTWEADSAPAIGDARYWCGEKIASGSRSDVYIAQRARFPTERVVVKVLRDGDNAGAFEPEWQTLKTMTVDPSFKLGDRIPFPIGRGVVRGGLLDGRNAVVFRWAPGYVRSLAVARALAPGGIDPRIAVWIWRRTLEVLAFIHRVRVAHRDITPAHLLFHENDHGIRVVGWSAASEGDDAAYRKDVAMSAVAVRDIMSSDGSPFSALADEVANGTKMDAWSLRDHVGIVGRNVYGGPQFRPLRID